MLCSDLLPALTLCSIEHAFHIFMADRADAVGREDLDRSLVVRHTEDHACAVGLLGQECVGIFKVDPVVTQQIQDIDQGTGLILKDDRKYLGQGADIPLLLENLHSPEGIINDHTDNAEILGLCQRQGAQINFVVLQDLVKAASAPGLFSRKAEICLTVISYLPFETFILICCSTAYEKQLTHRY